MKRELLNLMVDLANQGHEIFYIDQAGSLKFGSFCTQETKDEEHIVLKKANQHGSTEKAEHNLFHRNMIIQIETEKNNSRVTYMTEEKGEIKEVIVGKRIGDLHEALVAKGWGKQFCRIHAGTIVSTRFVRTLSFRSLCLITMGVASCGKLIKWNLKVGNNIFYIVKSHLGQKLSSYDAEGWSNRDGDGVDNSDNE